MKAKFTPGPWRIKGRTHSSGEFIRVESLHPTKHLYQVADVIAANGYDENEANARLIAAAPTLAKALTKLMQHFPTDGDMHEAGWTMDEINAACDAHDDARAALSKALGLEGEQG